MIKVHNSQDTVKEYYSAALSFVRPRRGALDASRATGTNTIPNHKQPNLLTVERSILISLHLTKFCEEPENRKKIATRSLEKITNKGSTRIDTEMKQGRTLRYQA